MKRGVTIGSSTRTAAPFLAEPTGYNSLLPGGIVLAGFAAGSVVPAGTLVGRTYAERETSAAFGPVAVDGATGDVTDEEIYLTAFDVRIGQDGNEAVAIKPGAAVYEARLPEFATLTAQVKAAIRSTYVTL